MAKMNKRRDPVRAPQQDRSQKRVALILDAARQGILEKGTAGLKMGDIAKIAKISMSSIYQYFPNKSAIIGGLAEQYLDQNAQLVKSTMADKPESLSALADTMDQLLEAYYIMHRDDPVVRDVWMGSATDKVFQEIEGNDTTRNLEVIFSQSKHLFPPQNHDAAKLVLFLIINFGGTAVATAVELSEDEGRFAMQEAFRMLRACWEVAVIPLGYPAKIDGDQAIKLTEGTLSK